jgi:transposase
MSQPKYAVKLTPGEREELRLLLKKGVLPVRTVKRALVLLRLDEGLSTPQAAAMFEFSDEGVRKVALRYRAGGLEIALWEGERPGKPVALDQTQQEKVVALACGPPPPGQARWTVRVLAEEVQKHKIVAGIGREAIRIALQHHDIKPWREKNVVRRAQVDEAYAERMDDVLETYETPYNP